MGPKTEPCGAPQVSGHDCDDSSDVLIEKERRETGLNPEESSVSKTEPGRQSFEKYAVVDGVKCCRHILRR